ncbi:MAG: isopentenyl phosphate kinase family protein [Chloroflexi bacterium]|nr:isopentenyl phosphate kinase family protein [Chloroflexota bacterium]
MSTVFLKLGGSLITDKDKPFTPRIETIRSIGDQIRKAREKNPSLRLLVGHGSGSFGHAAAKAAGYVEGDPKAFDPVGFQTIWMAAQKLNRIILDEFNLLGLPAISFAPSSALISARKKVEEWNIAPLKSAMDHNLLPIVFGDTVFDREFGGVIYSTEDLFLYLAEQLKPEQILLAGKEKGIWADFPMNGELISELSSQNFSDFRSSINASQSVDVTGGMLKKVQIMFQIKVLISGCQIHIFSGEDPDAIFDGLAGNPHGTLIS